MRTNQSSSQVKESTSNIVYDPVTDLYSRTLFTQLADALLRISLRQNLPVSVAVISLNDYDELEAKYHGDETQRLVKESADILKSMSRDSDVLSHFDEDKFALLLYNCNYQSSKIVAHRIREKVKGNISIHGDEITFGIGLAEFDRAKMENGEHLSDSLVTAALRSIEQAPV